MKPALAVLAAALLLASAPVPPLSAQNCAGSSTGLVPLADLGPGLYQGFSGGLYPGGSNAKPAAHEAAGLAAATAIVPRNAAGAPAPDGRVVLLSIGMSNTTQEFSTFVTTSNTDPLRHPSIVVVDGAQGGQTAAVIANPAANFWNVIANRLAAAGVTPLQVQVCWVKEADASPAAPFPAHAETLRDELRAIAQVLRLKYPNCRIACLSSRTYGGYATTPLNPEPWAYETGFAVKWVIEAQINGDPGLNHDPAAGPVLAPWLAWGPYLWADGIVPRSDGLTWECRDFAADGTHPGVLARFKVAALLDTFFRSDSATMPWYTSPLPHPTPAVVAPYGAPCGPGGNAPNLVAGPPFIGSPNFTVTVSAARPNSTAFLFASEHHDDIATGPGCHIYLDLASLFLPAPGWPTAIPTNGAGQGSRVFAVPQNPALMGVECFAQAVVLDPAGPAFPEIGGATLTRGLRIVFGTP